MFLVLATLGISATLMVTSVSDGLKGPTYDEPTYMASGYHQLAHGDFGPNAQHPPLAKHWLGLPLLWMVDDADARRAPTQGTRFLYKHGGRPGLTERMLLASRSMNIALAVLLFGLVWWVARGLFGPVGGLVSLTLAAFSPNLMAHGRLATLDMAHTLMTLVTVMTTWWALDKGRWWRFVLVGVALGATLATKISGLFALPIVGALVLLAPRLGLGAGTSLMRRAGYLGLVTATAVVALWATYFFTTEGGVLGHFGEAIEWQWEHGERGHKTYLLGEISTEGFWYFFAVVTAVKVPLGGLVAWFWGGARMRRSHGPMLLVLASYPVFLFVYLSLFSATQLGFSYLLSALPFVFIIAGALGPVLVEGLKAHRIAVIAILTLQVGAVATIHPHYLMYFNGLGGGPQGGPEVSIVRSDWGQDVPLLAKWAAERGNPVIHLGAYGSALPYHYGLRAHRLGCHPVRGVVAIHEVEYRRPRRRPADCYRWLDQHTPLAVLGHTIRVYDTRGTTVSRP